jgi:hypothetical protein
MFFMVGLHLSIIGLAADHDAYSQAPLGGTNLYHTIRDQKKAVNKVCHSRMILSRFNILAGLAMETFGVTPLRQLSLMLIDWLVNALFDGAGFIPRGVGTESRPLFFIGRRRGA